MASTINASTTLGLVNSADTSGILQLQTANTAALTIDASQNVGVGTASPSTKLTVVGNIKAGYEAATGIVIGLAPSGVPSNDVNAYVLWGDNTSFGGTNGDLVYVSRTSTSAGHRFYTGNGGAATEKLRLDNAGNLGLGVTPSGSWGTQAFMLAKSGASNPTYPFIASTDSQAVFIGSNSYWDGTNWKAQFGGAGVVAMHQKFNYNAISWHTAPAVSTGNTQTFTQAMTLGSSGDLLLGTTTNRLGEKLHVLGNGIVTSSAENTNMGLFGTFGSANLIIGAFNNLPVEFRQNNTERMRLDTSGNLLVGTTSASAGNTFGSGILARSTSKPLAAVCDASSGSSSVGIGRTTSTGNYVEFYYGTGLTSSTGTISTNGTTTAYNTTSDQRLKENIADADSASSLIDSLQVRQFDWKADGSHQRYGFVAQELVTVAPEAVHQPEDTEQMMAVDYSKLVPMLVKEIQSLRQRLAAANL